MVVPCPAQPSAYELEAWRNIGRYQGRLLSRAGSAAGGRVADGIAAVGKRAKHRLEEHPKADRVVSRGKNLVTQGTNAIGTVTHKSIGALPSWTGQAFGSIKQTVGKVSRAGLSPQRVLKKYRKRGHDVTHLADLRQLDLSEIDAVRGRAHEWYYPALAAISGAGAGLVMAGGELVVVAGAGVGAAPGAGAVAGAFVADASFILGLSSRCVGQVALYYGYDPAEPAEKLFAMSVVNVGTAVSSSAKTAALADISRLTQALVRNETWAVLNESVVARVAGQFTKAFGGRLTRQGLGKMVPAAGIVLGSTFNWATLERIVDAATIAYRRRFLLEKYPYLADGEATQPVVADQQSADSDQTISVLDELAEADGPDLRT